MDSSLRSSTFLSISTSSDSDSLSSSVPSPSPQSEISFSGFLNRRMKNIHFNAGKLWITYGPMCAGKSTTLINFLNTQKTMGLRAVYVKPTKDERSSVDDIKSFHDDGCTNLSKDIDRLNTPNIKDIFEILLEYDVIGIDEGQFFDDIKLVKDLVLEHKKIIHIASLDAYANNEAFGKVHEIIHLASPGCLNKIAALCMICAERDNRHEDAGFSFFLPGKYANGSIVIGSKKEYIPVCLYHHQMLEASRSSTVTD